MNDNAIRQLKRKVTMASMAAILVSIAALIVAINYAHYLQTMTNLHAVMEEIACSHEESHGEGRHEMMDFESEGGTEEIGKPDKAQTEEESGTIRHGGRTSADTQYGNRFFFVLLDAEGNAFVKSKGNDAISDEEATNFANQVLAGDAREGMLDDYLFSVEATDGGTRILFLDCTTETQSLHQLLTISIAVGGIAFLIASGFVFRFSSYAVRPLVDSTQKQKRFVADAGHELKTPLSVIATNMDILEIDLADQPDELEWIDSTNRQVVYMRDLVNNLISLSKMEEDEADLVFTDVSLSDVADECVYTFRSVAAAHDKQLAADIEEDLHTKGDEPSIRQLMTILIDNAVKYEAGDGTVKVTLHRKGKQAVFETRNAWSHDDGPQDLDSLFDRFVRGDRSRNRSEGTGGYGLGLSIARVIAEKNHARLKACEDEEGRIVFRATFLTR